MGDVGAACVFMDDVDVFSSTGEAVIHQGLLENGIQRRGRISCLEIVPKTKQWRRSVDI